jgi:hypothetical protein
LYDTLTTSSSLISPALSYAEYFYDSDPGIGNGIPISAFAIADSITHTDTLSTTILSAGNHSVYVRVRDTLNVWSLYEGGKFTICNLVPLADFSADTVCVNTPTTFTDLSTNQDTSFNYTYGWNFNNDLIIDDTTKGGTTYIFTTPGTHTVSLLVDNTNGCSDTVIKIIYVDSLPVVALVLAMDTVCKDDTLNLTGGTPIGGIYSGLGVYSGAFYADSVSAGIQNIAYTYFNSDSCSAIVYAQIYVSTCTGVSEWNANSISVSISPNPFKEYTKMTLANLNNSNVKLEFLLFDVFGKEIKNFDVDSNNILLSRENLPAGIYFYKIRDGQGAFASGKLIALD